MQRFNACIDTLRHNGQGYLVPDDRPVHGIGHSNGALLHLLIGSIYAPASASNVLISFNNKCVQSNFLPILRKSPSLRSAFGLAKGSHARTSLPCLQGLIRCQMQQRVLRSI